MSTKTGQNVALLFFSSCMELESEHQCNSCLIVKKPTKFDYANICSHINKAHREIIRSEIDATQYGNKISLESIMWPK